MYKETKNINIFNEEELKLIDYAFSKFDEYLESEEFVLIHNDSHFDNIFYYNENIKLIDFERAMYAPKDFELDILYRMIRMPWKFASKETEQYSDINDYKNIMSYIEKYYSKIINTPNLYQRLAIYDLIYFMKQLVNHPKTQELKDSVISSGKRNNLKYFGKVKIVMKNLKFFFSELIVAFGIIRLTKSLSTYITMPIMFVCLATIMINC